MMEELPHQHHSIEMHRDKDMNKDTPLMRPSANADLNLKHLSKPYDVLYWRNPAMQTLLSSNMANNG
ncbi:unnamed protein product [Clavelina lepadiformis]|uniref:Uncharacterized protein n=1 Tax=Clavelina lepadiformis TaxID=159417 RepID=A0ABP0F8B3_CLALP